MILPILEGFTAFLIILTVITQIIVPLWYNRRIFPIFNKRKSILEDSLKTLNELEDEKEMAAKVQKHASTLIKQEETKK